MLLSFLFRPHGVKPAGMLLVPRDKARTTMRQTEFGVKINCKFIIIFYSDKIFADDLSEVLTQKSGLNCYGWKNFRNIKKF